MIEKKNYKTRQKEIILDLIKNKKSEFTIKDIYEELNGSVGLTTIYRLVDKLVSENKINKYIKDNNNTSYQYLQECELENHFYLKCKKCGNLIHIDCDCVMELFNHIFIEHKFKPNNDNIIIRGICGNCMNS